MVDPLKVRTCLWFERDGEKAAELYVSLVPGSRITGTFRTAPDGPPLVVDFELAGVPYQALNGGPHYKLSPAASISVTTPDQAETDRLWHALLADGGEASHCGWLVDRYGMSWQIVPRALLDLLSAPDRAAAGRAMQAMLGMVKLDIAGLEAAFAGDG